MEIVFNLQFGTAQAVVLSAMSVYHWVGSSAGSGSNVGDNLKQIVEFGALPENTPENIARFKGTDILMHPPRDFDKPLPSGWKNTAKIFRTTEWFDVETWEGFVTCLLCQIPVVYGRGQHSIVAVGLEIDRNGKIWVVFANSWGSSWENGGFGKDSEKVIPSGIDAYGAFAPRVGIIPPSTIISLPPKAVAV